jgi:hypothetical protein
MVGRGICILRGRQRPAGPWARVRARRCPPCRRKVCGTPAVYRFDSTSSGLDASIKGYAQAADTRRGNHLRCRACGHPVTEDAERVSVSGSHVHTRTNPAGIEYCFGCFGAAPGCAVLGAATDEHTWFPGCRWRIAVCGSCGEHLGWSFSGVQRFFGLILARLVRGSDEGE